MVERRHRFVAGAVLFVAAFAAASKAQQEPRPSQGPTKTPPQTGETEGHYPRNRGADATRAFLGLNAPPDAAAAEKGSKIYATNCSFCHGPKATGGDTGPDLLRSALVLHDEKGEIIGPFVRSGRPARGMPAFPALSSAELYQVAEYLHLRVELAANRGTYQTLNVVTGNARAGEAWFQGPGGCTRCHSPTGDLSHIGARLSPADLQVAFLYPAARTLAGSASESPKLTVTLPSGERLSGTLKHLDDFNVSFYDTAGHFHSITLGDGTKLELEDRLAEHRRLLDHYTDTEMHNLTAYLSTLK